MGNLSPDQNALIATIPAWHRFMLTVLKVQSDNQPRMLRDLTHAVAEAEGLSEEQRTALLGSGQEVVSNRVAWAISYLKHVDALSRPRRACYLITQLGHDLLERHPNGITEAHLKEVAQPDDPWWGANRKANSSSQSVRKAGAEPPHDLDPMEMISQGIDRIQNEVKAELIGQLIAQAPAFFERAVVQLLVAMGYGGTGGRAAATRLVHDGGIDGVIDQDVLGLNKVYVQAKRYAPTNSVQRQDVQAFVGALSGKAEYGVMITTSKFSAGAREYADRDARARIILIDGQSLVDLMVRYRVGVQVKQSVHVVEIDQDFFE